jgi:hypothetical protein
MAFEPHPSSVDCITNIPWLRPALIQLLLMAMTDSRFIWLVEDFHLQAVEHARQTFSGPADARLLCLKTKTADSNSGLRDRRTMYRGFFQDIDMIQIEHSAASHGRIRGT